MHFAAVATPELGATFGLEGWSAEERMNVEVGIAKYPELQRLVESGTVQNLPGFAVALGLEMCLAGRGDAR